MSTIKLHALRQRINRKLAREGHVMRADGWEHGCCGLYVVWRRSDGQTTRKIPAWELIAYARELGVMKIWESEVDTLIDDEGREVRPGGVILGNAPAAQPHVCRNAQGGTRCDVCFGPLPSDSESDAADDVEDVDMPDCPVDICVPR